MTSEIEQIVPERRIRLPASISPEAQAALARSLDRPVAPTPALDDIAGWQQRVRDTDAALLPFMQMLAQMAGDVSAESCNFGKASGYLLNQADASSTGRVVYDIHGGALISGGGEICKTMGLLTAKSLQARCYAIDYRMPPLHPYPTPLDDCVEGYRFLLERHAPNEIIVRGASAGANLAGALILRARDEGLPLPAGVILATPEIDLTESGDSFRTNEYIDVVLPHPLMPINLLYAAGHDLAHPYLSPLFGDFTKGFPPTVITTGTRDLFLSNSVQMHNRLRRAGNHSELYIEEAMPHGGFFPAPEDAALAADVRNFADRVWSGVI